MAAADAKRVSETSGLDGLTNLLQLFGTQSQQKSTADTSGLTSLLNTLQSPSDPNAILASIFQQASGQIPKLQAAYGNAVGARSTGNSPVQAGLNELLKQTTLAGQQQIAQQTQQNQALQAQVAGKIADSTRTVNSTQNPNYGMAAKGLAGLQILGKLGVTDKLKGLFSDAPASSVGGTAFSVPDFSSSLSSAPGIGGAGLFGDASGSFFGASGGDAANSLSSDAVSQALSSDDIASSVGSAFSDAGDWLGDAGNTVAGWFGFAEGGLVGRDGKKMGSFQPAHYADGGIVKSPGGRRSSAPAFTPDAIQRTAAINPGTPAVGGGGGSSGVGNAPTGSGGTGSGASSGGNGSGVGSFDLGNFGVPVNYGGSSAPISNEVGSGSTDTGIPDWVVGLVGSALFGSIAGTALKYGNKYLRQNDPTNPSSAESINGGDSEDDAAQAAQAAAAAAAAPAAAESLGVDGGATPVDRGNSTVDDRDRDPDDLGDLGDLGGVFNDAGIDGGATDGGGGSTGGGDDWGGGPDPAQAASYNAGGQVGGPKNVNKDIVPAVLTPGEFVMKKGTVEHFGSDFFDMLNQFGESNAVPAGRGK